MVMTSRPPPRTRRTRLRPSVRTSRNSMSGNKRSEGTHTCTEKKETSKLNTLCKKHMIQRLMMIKNQQHYHVLFKVNLRKLIHPIFYTYVFYEIANQGIAINICCFGAFILKSKHHSSEVKDRSDQRQNSNDTERNMVENFEEEEVSKYAYLSNEILVRIRFRPPSPECKTPDMFVSVQLARTQQL